MPGHRCGLRLSGIRSENEPRMPRFSYLHAGRPFVSQVSEITFASATQVNQHKTHSA